MRQPDVSPPFRWGLIAPDQLGSLLAGTAAPDLWFLDALVECAGKVVARSGDGDLFFVGRSLDSTFDLLGGSFAESGPHVCRLPFSFARPAARTGRWWQARPLSTAERARARRLLGELGLAPAALARRARPVVFVDVVNHGSTFTELFALLREWADEDRAPWAAIRRTVRFIGVTKRSKTSPNAYRWHQHAAWTSELPAAAVRNVSVDVRVWRYLADNQVKLTRSRTSTWSPGRSVGSMLAPATVISANDCRASMMPATQAASNTAAATASMVIRARCPQPPGCARPVFG